jgi:hypothetical protein
MEILTEIHFGITLALSLLFLGIYVMWSKNRAYGLFLDKQVKKGKLWVYLPIGWNTKKRATNALILKVLMILSTICGFIAFIQVFSTRLDMIIGSTALYVIILLILGNLTIKHRFKQQENAYFGIQDAIIAEYEREGKRITESKLLNLASYQFQNALRAADSNKRLLKELDERSAAR